MGEIKNKLDHAAGQVKETVGEATGNDEAADEGRAQQVKSDVRDAGDKVKDAAKGVVDDVRDAVGH